MFAADSSLAPRRCAIAIFAFLAAIYALTVNSFFAGYGFETFLTTENLFLHRSYTLSREPLRQINQYYVEPNVPSGAKELRPPLQSFLQVPFYAVGYAFDLWLFQGWEKYARVYFVLLFNCVVTALQAVVLFHFLGAMGKGPRTALAVALLYGLSTMAFPYSSLGMEPLMLLCLLTTYYYLYRLASEGRRSFAVLAGIASGALLITKSYAALFLLPIVIYFFASQRKTLREEPAEIRFRDLMDRLTLFATPILFGLALFLADNVAKRGSLFNTGYGAVHYEPHWLPRNLTAMIVGAGASVLVYNPVCILAVGAARRFAGEQPAAAWGFGSLLATTVLFFAGLGPRLTFHDEVYGPRYLLPVVPVLVMLVAFVPFHSWSRRLMAAALGLAGLAVQIVMKPFYFANHILILARLNLYTQDNVDFVPALSPLAVNLAMFRSAVHRLMWGSSLAFTYTPAFLPHLDPSRRVVTYTLSLAGYDSFDLYWAWAFQLRPKLAVASMAVLALVAGLAGAFLARTLLRGSQDQVESGAGKK